MKKAFTAALVFFLVLLLVLGLVFPKRREGFVPGDARPQFAPCMNDEECASGKCSQEKCV